MKQMMNSDKDTPAMLACNAFEKIIDEIRYSNLNFQLHLSPFSAQISLKKSLILDKSGIPRLPPTHEVSNHKHEAAESDIEAFARKNVQLVADLDNLRGDYDRVVDNYSDALRKIKSLEAEILALSIKKENNPSYVENLEYEVSKVTSENKKHRETIEAQTEEIHELESSIKVKTEVANQINKKLSEFRTTSETEKAAIKKAHKAELKYWKKELGEERKEKMKFADKLEKTKSEIKRSNEKKMEKESVQPHISLNSHDSSYLENSSLYLTTSMVSHWSPNITTMFKRPSSITSMVTHCALHPPPGSSLLSMSEVLEALNKAVENLFNGIKWFESTH